MKSLKIIINCIVITTIIAFQNPRSGVSGHEDLQDMRCLSQLETYILPTDNSWMSICLTDPNAPEASKISETSFKLIIDHPDPGSLEIQISRTNSAIIKSVPSNLITNGGIGMLTQIHDFDGLPSAENWIVQIRNTVPGLGGSIQDISISTLYASFSKMSPQNIVNDGKPTSKRIADDAISISSNNLDNRKSDKGITSNVQLTEDSVSIMQQTFEGPFPPSTGWEISDENPDDNLEYYWDDDNLRAFGGSLWAAWPARGGSNGIDPTISTTYPKNMNTWMIYGPFDLSNAKSAQISFMLWRHIEIHFDTLFFGVSGDKNTFDGWDWDGDVDWESISIGLDNYLGDPDVWIAWQFVSDGSFQYDGPWIDNIVLDFEPGDVAIHGRFSYADRWTNMQGANAVKVQLWDWDADGDGNDLLAEASADNNGYYSFSPVLNWDEDDTDPILNNRRIDPIIRWVLENDHSVVSNLSNYPYAWISTTHNNIPMGTTIISASLPFNWANIEAMWIFQDIQRTREYFLNHTYPQRDPGFLAAHWEKNQNSENGVPGSHFWALINPHVYIAHDSRLSLDTIIHELGHHIMWNQTGQWLWYDFGCFQHDLFTQESVECAWSEGWSDYFAITVNGDACYDLDQFTCSGHNLENHTRNDPNIEGSWWGDYVEGRVAGALYDLMDSSNEAPWYDTAYCGFNPIIAVALDEYGKTTLQEFWAAYFGGDKHNGVRSIYQNTIDYDQAPIIIPIPDRSILQNFTSEHFLNLSDYVYDYESSAQLLTYQIISVSDTRCGISLDSHWVNASPQMNWVGSCYVTVRVNDSIKTVTTGFWLQVLQINSRISLPVIMRD